MEDKTMQKISTQIFKIASLAFGLLGIVIVFTVPESNHSSLFYEVLMKSFMTTVFIILPSFAISVATKYLTGSHR
jgi:hypothetical protein